MSRLTSSGRWPLFAAADIIISMLQLFTGAQLLPRFVVFVSSAILVPVFVLVSGLSGGPGASARTSTG